MLGNVLVENPVAVRKIECVGWIGDRRILPAFAIYFVVGGEVTKPGKYDLRGDTTVLEAITIAGGVSDKSRTSQVLLFRRVSNDWVEVKEVDMRRMLRERDLSEDLHLRPGDMVLVPKSTFSKLARFIPVPSLGMYFNPLFR